MKRILLASLTAAILVTPSTALAQPQTLNSGFSDLFVFKPFNSPLLATPQPDPPVIQVVTEKPKPTPKPKVYTVVEGDNLSKIGTEHNVEWQRLWAKNTQLDHPDVLKIGEKITVPLDDEELEREIPAAVSLPAVTPGVEPFEPARTTPAPPQRASASYDSSNTYSYGYCTWYVKNRRGASLPNGLGNANTWYSRAAGMGMAVGSTPRAGAVGTTTRGALGHVVYVESVNANGTINISEMNAPTWGAVTHRTASASEFVYIY